MCRHKGGQGVHRSHVPGQPVTYQPHTDYYWKDRYLSEERYRKTGKVSGTYQGEKIRFSAFEALADAQEFASRPMEEQLESVRSGEREGKLGYRRHLEFISEFGRKYDPESAAFADAPSKHISKSRSERIEGTNSMRTVKYKEINPEWTAWVKKTKRALRRKSHVFNRKTRY